VEIGVCSIWHRRAYFNLRAMAILSELCGCPLAKIEVIQLQMEVFKRVLNVLHDPFHIWHDGVSERVCCRTEQPILRLTDALGCHKFFHFEPIFFFMV
jgi:hypothetical protein